MFFCCDAFLALYSTKVKRNLVVDFVAVVLLFTQDCLKVVAGIARCSCLKLASLIQIFNLVSKRDFAGAKSVRQKNLKLSNGKWCAKMRVVCCLKMSVFVQKRLFLYENVCFCLKMSEFVRKCLFIVCVGLILAAVE